MGHARSEATQSREAGGHGAWGMGQVNGKGLVYRILRLPSDRKRFLAEAVFSLFCAKILLLVLPVRIILDISTYNNRKTLKNKPVILDDIAWALSQADRLAFWKNRCLVSSIAGMWMLGRRNIEFQFFIGVMHDQKGKLKVHAWLKAGEMEIVKKDGDYYELYTFRKN